MSERWERITRLFDAARALDPPERGAFLDSACGGDAGLRSEFESLLANDRYDSFLARPASAELSNAMRQAVALPEAGQVLRGRYRLEARMATGGQALVYRAMDQVLSRPVVVKFLRTEGRGDNWLQSRLRQEMEVLARIDHPAVVGVLDSGELDDGSPFLVIEYIEGESLREALRNGPLGPQRAAAILRQTGAALSAVHALGIAHRDLKPENIMLQRLSDGTESVVLIDFGIAKIERSQLDPGTTTVTIAGTARYMAPEQLQGESSPASDVYSLALVACEMLCGHPDIRALPRGVGKRTRRTLEAALAFRPEDRPRKVRAWCEELAETLTSHSRRRFVMAGSAAAVLAGGAFAGGRWYASVEQTPRVIEYVGAFDPLTEGFRIHNDVAGTIAENPDRTGYDGWRVTTARQGDYYRHLSGRQKRLALERGWKLSAAMRTEEGQSYVAVDFAGYGRRFSISVINLEPGRDVVRLQTQILPDFQGIDFPVAASKPAYRHYELQYDPGLRSAALWMNGRKMPGEYRGFTQFQEDWGVMFGAVVYGGSRGMAAFQSVRFEIAP